MDVLITQKKMTDSEAFVKARGGGNLIGKAMYGGGKITMKQLYLQSFEVVFDAYFKPGLVERSGHIITSMEVASYRPFYRPYYVAFYGEMEMGKKVRYIAIEADGYKTDSSL